MLSAIKAIIFLQSYLGALWVVFWIGSFTTFTPFWLKLGATSLACIFLLAPIAWVFLDDERRKDSSRRDRRLEFLEREVSGYD